MKTGILILILLFTSCNHSNEITEKLSPGKVINQLLKKGEKFQYTVDLNKGEYFEMTVMQKGIDLYITIFDQGDKALKTYDSSNDPNGPERVKFVSPADGKYKIEITTLSEVNNSVNKSESETIHQGEFEINSIKLLTSLEYSKLPEEKTDQENIVSIFKVHAHPLKGVTPGIGIEDLDFLKTVLKDVSVVGLGEATHGTREFFQMKSRMLEFLVKEMGFTVFAIEASYAGCNNINEYVLYGKGNAHTALASQGFWTWDTEEVIDMIEWMRAYNQTVPENKKIKFLGFDIQHNNDGFNVVQNYLKKVDSPKALQTKHLFNLLRRMDNYDTAFINTDSCKMEFQSLIEFIGLSKENYIQGSSPEEYEYALQHAKVIDQFFETFFIADSDIEESVMKRDNYMSSNFKYIVQQETPGTKFVVWAHNGHIKKNDRTEFKPFGKYLLEMFGNAYYAFGFSFSKGSYQAIEYSSSTKFTPGNMGKGLQEFTVEEAMENSLDWYLAQTGFSKFIVNFWDSNLQDSLKGFLKSELKSRSIGSGSDRYNLEKYYTPIDIEKDFDGIIFIDNTTRSKPTPTGVRTANP